MTDAFRESPVRRTARETITIAKAIRAGRTRCKTTALAAANVDGRALRNLVAESGADARLVRVTINRPHWTPTGTRVAAGDQVTWLAWGHA